MDARPARSADLPSLLSMMADFNEHERIPFDEATFTPRLEQLLKDAELGGAVIFALDGKDVGYAIVTYGFDLEYGGKDAFLTELWIVPSERRRGLGGTALAAAEELARQGGAHALHLLVRHENSSARSLYERAGYVTEPRAVMTKRL